MLFLFREDYYRNEKEDGAASDSNQAEIIVAKNRHGELDLSLIHIYTEIAAELCGELEQKLGAVFLDMGEEKQ